MLKVPIRLLASRDPKEASLPLTHRYWSLSEAGWSGAKAGNTDLSYGSVRVSSHFVRGKDDISEQE